MLCRHCTDGVLIAVVALCALDNDIIHAAYLAIALLLFWQQALKVWLLVCRYYTDGVLVAVVALCALDNDIIHAAYLAIALLLFRQRDQLREQGNFLFKWLVIYNFLVMLTTIIYQAPLYQLLNRHPPDGSEVILVTSLFQDDML